MYLETMSDVIPRMGPKIHRGCAGRPNDAVPDAAATRRGQAQITQLHSQLYMPMKTLFRSAAVIIVLLIALLVFKVCTYTVAPNENVIITQFGKPIGKPVTTAGLHFKLPFIQQVNRLDVRIHEWDGQAVAMPTRDKLYVIVDSFGRWQISDPLLWFTRLRDERSALVPHGRHYRQRNPERRRQQRPD